MESLNYFKDEDDNYIIRRESIGKEDATAIVVKGTSGCNYLLNKENIEEQVEKIFEMLANMAEMSVCKDHKVTKEQFFYEKIVGNYSLEEEYNPLFKNMNEEEVKEFKGDSQKVKINVAFEIHIPILKHLWFKAFTTFIKERLK